MEHASKTFFDEMHLSPSTVRDLYAKYSQWLGNVSGSKLESRRQEAELLFRRVGITFNVYGEQAETERLIPFDVIPRILAASEWKVLSSGVIQRVKALNMFLHDIYHQREIIKAGIISDSILKHAQYRPEMINVDVPNGIYAHIAGVDIVRTAENQFYVLEDNLRTPSGVSYMLENRKMMMRLFPELFRQYSIAPVEHYPQMLKNNLRAVAQSGVKDPTIVLLTPGAYNSAYFEHAFLAQQMGVELVEGQDLFVRNNAVYMRTTEGPRYVSGYLFTDDGHLLDSHAWADAWLAGIGWVSVDVSNLCLADAKYVRLATGLDYHEACPVKGLRVGGGLETLHVGVNISQSAEDTLEQMQQSQQ